jgi:PilZ domain
MAILAELYPQKRPTDRRGKRRRRLQLSVRGMTPEGDCAPVVIHDISVTGLLLETSAELLIGETIEVDVPEGGPTSAIVMWNSGRFFGCQFEGRISPASVSAAVLRSPFDPKLDSPEPTVGKAKAYASRPVEFELSPMAKAWVLVGLVVATWAIIFALIEWLTR